mgnify:CR=1 FL=1
MLTHLLAVEWQKKKPKLFIRNPIIIITIDSERVTHEPIIKITIPKLIARGCGKKSETLPEIAEPKVPVR